jgi:DNA-binding protein YbaB
MSSLQDQIDQLMADFDRTTKAIDSMSKELNAASHTKRSKNRMVSVTVDSKGGITDLTFHTTAYRTMAQAELSQLLLSVIEEARAGAQAAAEKSMKGFMPESSSLMTSMSEGKPLTMEQVFGELEQAFAWGNKHAPQAEGAQSPVEPGEHGWTGERKAVAKPAPPAKRRGRGRS